MMINRRLLRPARSTGRSRTDRIWNNSRVANYRFPEFQLPGFHNGFQFNCHFGLRLDFGLDTLHYPLQHRHRFWLGFFMRLQHTCVPATLVTSRTVKRLVRHLRSHKSTVNKILSKTIKSQYGKSIYIHALCIMVHHQNIFYMACVWQLNQGKHFNA